MLRSHTDKLCRTTQRSTQSGDRQLGRIIFVAQMRGDQMLQTTHIQAGQKFGRLPVVQMPESPAHTLFQAIGIIPVGEQLAIVIAFQHQRVATAQGRFDMRRATARIGQHTEPSRAIAEHELHRLGGIMRHGIGLHV